MIHTAPAQYIPSGVFPVIPKETGVQWLRLNRERMCRRSSQGPRIPRLEKNENSWYNTILWPLFLQQNWVKQISPVNLVHLYTCRVTISGDFTAYAQDYEDRHEVLAQCHTEHGKKSTEESYKVLHKVIPILGVCQLIKAKYLIIWIIWMIDKYT